MLVKGLFCTTLLAFVALQSAESLSMQQLQKMMQTVRRSCLQKIDATEDAVDGLKKGLFPEDENLACYTNCVMKAMRSFRNGAIDFDALLKQMDMTLPPELIAPTKEAIMKCREDEYTGDPCSVSYRYVKCYYEADPEKFLFP